MLFARALLVFAALVSLPAGPAFAQTVTSAGPDKVSVSIYRAPGRDPDEALQLGWLRGYALITEIRTVAIPEGKAVIRFEGVAGGVLPESAIVTGLPAGVREKNLDADLLSERSLYSRSLGRPVTIRRTRDGKVTEERAVIRSGPEGAAIFETRDGFVAADCRAQDAIVYEGLPAGLSAKPTLSIETESPRSGQVTLTLSYLAWGFDWQANYVATMRPDGKSADLFAWVTLASGDVTSFHDAETMVIAGKVNREDDNRPNQPGFTPLTFHCFAYPQVEEGIRAEDMEAMPVPAPMAMMMERASAQDIVVTGSHVTREELGDLKLYRVPHTTSVASMSQKQVAMLDYPSVPVEIIYRSRLHDDAIADPGGVPSLLLRAQNRAASGLGIPLPQGPVAVFERYGERRILMGEGEIADKAVNEEVEVRIAAATQVTASLEGIGEGGNDWEDYALVVTNALPHSIRYEAELQLSDSYKRSRTSTLLMRRKGKDVWAVEVRANSVARLRFRLTEVSGD